MGSSAGPPISGENRAKTCTGEEDRGDGDKELQERSSSDAAACTHFFVISVHASLFRCCERSLYWRKMKRAAINRKISIITT